MSASTPSARDGAMSSVLGFIVGFVLLAGAMATVGYVLITTADSGPSETDVKVSSSATRAIDALVETPGHPSNWHEPDDLWDDAPGQIGLLREGSDIASLDKIRRIQDGGVNSTILTRSNNLLADDVRLDATATVVPVPAMRPPSTNVHAVVNGTIDGDMDQISTSSVTDDALAVYESSNEGFTSTTHAWTWREGQHPDDGLGNTFVDDPWHVETQAIPVMAGLAATYTFADPNQHTSISAAAQDAHEDYTDDPNPEDRLTRFHVVTDGEPEPVHNSSSATIEDHTLTVSFRKQTGGGSSPPGKGLWRTWDGMRSYAMLPNVDVTNAEDANLSFDYHLKADDDETTLCEDKDILGDCVKVRPAIRFWNTSADGGDGAWTRLDHETSACDTAPATDETWNATADAEASGDWTAKKVDLCEALNHTDGSLWLSFEWYTECINSLGNPGPCETILPDLGADPEAGRLWFIDNVEIDVEEEVVYETGFEPGGEMETLFAGHGVDHGFHEDGARPEHSVGPIRHFVLNEGNVVAYQPAKEGHWLGSVGLQSLQRSETRHVETVDSDRLVMRMPYELPLHDRSYDASPVGWQTNESPLNDTSVKNTGFQALDTVQQNTPSSSDPVATLITGIPFDGGGRVSAIGYNMTDMNKTQLRDKVADNLHAATVFLDPTFDVEGADVASADGVSVSAPSRVVLAEVTEDGDHQVPIKVTLYAWTEGVG